MRLYDTMSGKLLASIDRGNLGKWCDRNGYMPHRPRTNGYWVISKSTSPRKFEPDVSDLAYEDQCAERCGL